MMTKANNLVVPTLEEGVLTICLNRPDKQNALTNAMYMTMVDIMTQAEANDAVKVLVLTGEGPHFTAGNDIADFLAEEKPIEQVGAVVWLRCLSALTKPVIAQVKGNAVGVGTTCLFHCDLIYSDNTSVFRMPFTHLGLCPEAGVSMLLPRLIGHHKASEYLLLGSRFSAEEALEMGIINEIVATEALDTRVKDVAQQLASLPQESVLETKRLLKREQESVTDRMDQEFMRFGELLRGDTAKTIFQKFLDH